MRRATATQCRIGASRNTAWTRIVKVAGEDSARLNGARTRIRDGAANKSASIQGLALEQECDRVTAQALAGARPRHDTAQVGKRPGNGTARGRTATRVGQGRVPVCAWPRALPLLFPVFFPLNNASRLDVCPSIPYRLFLVFFVFLFFFVKDVLPFLSVTSLLS